MTRTICFFTALTMFLAIGQANAATRGVVCRLETESGILLADRPQNLVLKVTLDAPPAPANLDRPPVNLSLVLDRSGSMSGTKIRQAREAAVEALERLGIRDLFSVVVYDTHVQTIVPAQAVTDTGSIARLIRRIEPGGSTALFGGVSQGAAEIRRHLTGDYVHRIILLSDGLANVGPRQPEDLGRLGAALAKEDISVTTMGVGTDYNEDLMARLAQKSDGNTYFVESSMDLPRIFAAELGDVLNVVAKQVELTITLPDNVTPVRIIGRDGRIRNNRIHLSMNQLYGNQEKYALVEVALPASRDGASLEVARASVAYENPYTRQRETASGVSVARFSRNRDLVEQSANLDVVREYQLNLNALVQEKAIELSDKGETAAAAAELKESAARLKAVGSQFDDQELLEEADALESQAEAIEAEGMSKKNRKVLRTKSYQKKHQQYAQ